MNFKVDENLPLELVLDLRTAGHAAESVHGEGLSGASDAVIVEKARSEGLVLFTMDKGIADPRAYPPRLNAGIVLFRPRSSGRGAVLSFVRRHLALVLRTALAGHLLVVSEQGIRVR